MMAFGSGQWKVSRSDELSGLAHKTYPGVLCVHGLLSPAGLDAKGVMEHSEALGKGGN